MTEKITIEKDYLGLQDNGLIHDKRYNKKRDYASVLEQKQIKCSNGVGTLRFMAHGE